MKHGNRFQLISYVLVKQNGPFLADRFASFVGCWSFVVGFLFDNRFDGTTACEKPLFQFIFVFEYLIYSSTNLILYSLFWSVNTLLLKTCV